MAKPNELQKLYTKSLGVRNMAAAKNNAEIPLNTRVEMIRRFFSDSKPANHPITEHPVSKQEEYVRDLYLEMLCVMAQYENQNPENAFVLIKRILAACEKAQPLNEYIKRSMEITTERTSEFIRQCKSNQLREIFMIDSMLLSCSQGTPNEKQVEFLTQFGEMLDLKRNDLLEISGFTVAILEQNSDAYQSCIAESNLSLQEAALCYAKQFVNGKIIETSTRVVFYALQRTDMPFLKEDILIENKEQVEFENLTFVNTTVSLSSVKNVSFLNCAFRNYSNKAAIVVSTVNNINIAGCIFADCFREKADTDSSCGIVVLNKIGTVKMNSSAFSNCSIITANRAYSGLVCVGDYDKFDILADEIMEAIIIDACEFKKIDVRNTWSTGCARTIINGITPQSVTNSTFFDCQGYALFYGTPQAENNHITNCTSFGG